MRFPQAPADDGWRVALGMVEVPEEVGRLAVLPGAGNWSSGEDVA